MTMKTLLGTWTLTIFILVTMAVAILIDVENVGVIQMLAMVCLILNDGFGLLVKSK